ncbi:TonB-dependent receptor [Olivibacter domesticus]|nr:TonB-dependent receptor [Olivibacter domesticus]
MKITTLLLLLALSSVSAKSYSQLISLKAAKSSLTTLLRQVESQSAYRFVYDRSELEGMDVSSISLKNIPIAKVMDRLTQDVPIDYEIFGTTVVLRAKAKPHTVIQQEDRDLRGLVLDEAGLPLAGASVVLQGSKRSASTDTDGKFLIRIPSEIPAVLTISYIGYMSKDVSVGQLNDLRIALSPDLAQLDQVVVIGYGTAKKTNLTGAVSTVDLKRNENAPVTNASQLLQGVEGVYVNQPGGQPGRDVATVRVRGQGTLNNNNPLVLVNGVEFPMDNVNPADIASVTVLKDAASAAIYGSRAANGVILITTKSGAAGAFQINYANYFGFQEANYLPDFVKDPIQFMRLRNQAQINEGRAVVDYSDELIEEYQAGMKSDPLTYPNNDWFKIIFGKGAVQNHGFQFSGGTDKLTHLLSLNYLSQKGAVMGTDAKRYSLNYSTQAQLTNRIKVGGVVNINYKDFNEPTAGVGNLMEMTFKAQAFHPTYLADGRYANTFIRTPGHNIYRHPLVLANEGENNTVQQRGLVNIFAEVQLPFDITYKINGAINKADDEVTKFVPDAFVYQVKTGEAQRVPYDGGNPSNRGLRKTSLGTLNTTLFQTLNWSRSFAEKHQVNALLGYSREHFSDGNFFAQNEGYLGNDLYELNAGSSNPLVGGTSTEAKMISYFGRFNYNYKEKYLLEANFRYDGSSRFAKGNQWGFFPSFSAGWRLNTEPFLKDTDWLNELKLRASYGQLGNERIELFRYVNLIALGADYPFGSTVSSGAAVLNYNDPNITWETTTMANIGVDAALFDNKLSVTVEAFRKRTSDILQTVILPQQVGSLGGPIQNIGTVDNNGVELVLGYQHKLGDVGMQLNGSVTYVKNKVVDLGGQVIYSGRRIIREGSPINSYYLIHANGIFQTEEEIANSPFQTNNTKPGYLKYEDANGDGFISESDRKISGSNIPKLTYQFNLNFNYRNFSLNSFFQGVGSVYTYAENIGAMPFWFGTSVPRKWVTDAWTPENRDASLPILTTFEGSQTENFRSSDFWLRNVAYLRLKNLQFAYDFPTEWVNKLGLSKFRIFVNAQNLFTFSGMKDFDPEKNLDGSTFYEYPTVKTYTAGLNLTF